MRPSPDCAACGADAGSGLHRCDEAAVLAVTEGVIGGLPARRDAAVRRLGERMAVLTGAHLDGRLSRGGLATSTAAVDACLGERGLGWAELDRFISHHR